jgi:hypothetical protein
VLGYLYVESAAHELHDAVNQTLWTSAITAESVLRELDQSSPLYHRVSRVAPLGPGSAGGDARAAARVAPGRSHRRRYIAFDRRASPLGKVFTPEAVGDPILRHSAPEFEQQHFQQLLRFDAAEVARAERTTGHEDPHRAEHANRHQGTT